MKNSKPTNIHNDQSVTRYISSDSDEPTTEPLDNDVYPDEQGDALRMTQFGRALGGFDGHHEEEGTIPSVSALPRGKKRYRGSNGYEVLKAKKQAKVPVAQRDPHHLSNNISAKLVHENGEGHEVHDNKAQKMLGSGDRGQHGAAGKTIAHVNGNSLDEDKGEIMEDGSALYSQNGQLLEEVGTESGDDWERRNNEAQERHQNGNDTQESDYKRNTGALTHDYQVQRNHDIETQKILENGADYPRLSKRAIPEMARGGPSPKKRKTSRLAEASTNPVYHTPDYPSSPPSGYVSPSRSASTDSERPYDPDKDDDYSPFKTTTASLYLPVPPVAQHHPIYGILAHHIAPLLLTYYHPMRGVILSWHDARFSTSPANPSPPPIFDDQGVNIPNTSPTYAMTIHSYAPPMAWLTLEFMLFKPEPGDYVKGFINLQSETNIGLVCYNFFTASIERQRLPKEWEWVSTREGEESSDAAGRPRFEPLKGSSQQEEEQLIEHNRRFRKGPKRRRSRSRSRSRGFTTWEEYESSSSSDDSEEEEEEIKRDDAQADQEAEHEPDGYFVDAAGAPITDSMEVYFRVVSVHHSGGLPRDFSFMSVHGTLLPLVEEEELRREERRGKGALEAWRSPRGWGLGMARRMGGPGMMPSTLREGIREAELREKRGNDGELGWLERKHRDFLGK